MTTPAKRPSAARQRTRTTEAKRDDALDQGAKITVDGSEYVVRAGDLSALDSRALRKEVGVSFIQLINELQSDADIDSIAAIMWLARRIKGEVTLRYDEVAAEVGYDVLETIEFSEPGAEDATEDPEG